MTTKRQAELAWTEDEAVLKKYPMLRLLAGQVLAAYAAKGIDPGKADDAEVAGQEEPELLCNGTTGSGWGLL